MSRKATKKTRVTHCPVTSQNNAKNEQHKHQVKIYTVITLSLHLILFFFLRLCVTHNAWQLPFVFFSLCPSRQCFWTHWQKLFLKFCPIAALSACDQDRS